MGRKLHILVYKFDIFPYHDIIATLKKQGHSVDVLAFPLRSHAKDLLFEETLEQTLSAAVFDCVFSVNYVTAIAEVCHRRQLPYICWCCDTPLLSMYHPSVSYPENKIYLFDRAESTRFIQRGIKTAYHLPLAATPKHLQPPEEYSYDISFIGNLYDKNRYDEMAKILPDYLTGYMDAAIEAQLQIQGGNLFPKMLTDEIIAALEPFVTIENEGESQAGIRLHFATSVLSYKAASLNRISLLNTLSRSFRGHASIHLFTTSDTSPLTGVKTHPAADYHTEAPAIFSRSKINLNFTAPNIESGIPLRVFDILSAGGFLMTNYQSELPDYFKPDADLVIFEDAGDCVEKAAYYLQHEKERLQIAKHGFQTLCNYHTYETRLAKILPP